MGLPILTGFVKTDLALSASTAGFVVSAYLLGKLCGSYTAGRLADRAGEARVLVAGSVVAGAMLLLAAQAAYPLFFLVFWLAGLAGSGATPAGGSLVRNAFPPHARGIALGLRQTGIPVGGLIAAALLPWVAHAYGWRWSLRVAALVCVLGTAPLLRLARSKRSPRPAAAAARPRVASRQVVLATLWGTTAVMGQFALLIFVPLDLHERTHLSLAAAATFAAVLQVAGIVGRIGWGWVSDRTLRHGRAPLLVVLTAGGVFAPALLCALPREASLVWWVLAIVVGGVTVLGFQGIWVTILTEIVPENVVGAAMGFAVTFTIAGGAIAPPVFGAVADATGSYRAVWALLAGAMLLSFVPAVALARLERRLR